MAARIPTSTRSWLAWLAWIVVVVPASGLAQTAAPSPLTLPDAVQLALKNYPALRESRARTRAQEQEIAVAKTAYLPRLDMVWQVNRATHNNVFGLLLPRPWSP